MRLLQILPFAANFVVSSFFGSSWISVSTASPKNELPKNFLQKLICYSLKMDLLKNINLSTITGLLFVNLLYSCSASTSHNNQANQSFREKYGKEIKKYNSGRVAPKQDIQMLRNFSPVEIEKSSFDSAGYNVDAQQHYANVDADEYLDTKARQFFPDAGDLSAARGAQKFPEDIFVITYRTDLSPAFVRYGAEFDAINVPPYDVYGVRTAMSDKEYLLVGNGSLQRNIDQINDGKSKEDAEISEILVKEQRQLKRKQRMLKAFGPNALELSDSIKEKKSDKKDMIKSDQTSQDKNKNAAATTQEQGVGGVKNSPSSAQVAVSNQATPVANNIVRN